MDYFQGVVAEYLRTRRSVFVNPEMLIQLKEGRSPGKGEHWYCDLVAVDLSCNALYLCEVSYSNSMHALAKRLSSWAVHWPVICDALRRDCAIGLNWTVEPWCFVPSKLRGLLERRLDLVEKELGGLGLMPQPLFTNLEDVVPWSGGFAKGFERKSTG